METENNCNFEMYSEMGSHRYKFRPDVYHKTLCQGERKQFAKLNILGCVLEGLTNKKERDKIGAEGDK